MKLCFFKALGIMDALGNFNATKSIILFSEGDSATNVQNAVNKCKGLKGSDACNTADLIYDCLVANNLL